MRLSRPRHDAKLPAGRLRRPGTPGARSPYRWFNRRLHPGPYIWIATTAFQHTSGRILCQATSGRRPDRRSELIRLGDVFPAKAGSYADAELPPATDPALTQLRLPALGANFQTDAQNPHVSPKPTLGIMGIPPRNSKTPAFPRTPALLVVGRGQWHFACLSFKYEFLPPCGPSGCRYLQRGTGWRRLWYSCSMHHIPTT